MTRAVVVIFGLMGVGKTTLALALGRARGWPVLHSDSIRKALAGLAPTTQARFPFGQGIYQEDFSRRTYEEMRRQARQLLDAGTAGVILDASFKSAAERAAIRTLAADAGGRALLVYCFCRPELLRQRLRNRADNAGAISDGRLDLVELQMQDFEPLSAADRPLLRLDTGQDRETALRQVEDFVDTCLESA